MNPVDSYKVLAERYKYPESKNLRHLLSVLMTLQQAAIAVELPVSNAEIARKLGITEEKVKQEVETLFQRGIVFPTSKGYFFARSLIQLHDATQSDPRQDSHYGKKLFDAWEKFCDAEWYDDMARERSSAAGRESLHMRVLPMYRAIEKMTGVLPCEDIRQIIKEASVVSIVPCPCRRQTKRCNLPVDVCIQLDRGAEYAIQRGTGKKLTYEETMKAIDESEETGLVHRIPNKRANYGVICNCCADDCVALVAYNKIGKLNELDDKSRFLAKVNVDACNGCQTCIDRCQYNAIELVKIPGSKKMKAEIAEAKCMGCGSCVIKCPENAINFTLVRPEEHIPVK